MQTQSETKKQNQKGAEEEKETSRAPSIKEQWALMKPSRDLWKEHLLFSSYESWDIMRRRMFRSEEERKTCCIYSPWDVPTAEEQLSLTQQHCSCLINRYLSVNMCMCFPTGHERSMKVIEHVSHDLNLIISDRTRQM